MATLKSKQIANAKQLGAKAFQNGMKCICAMDKELMSIVNARIIGETPKGEAKSTSLMKAWNEGWMIANLK